MSKSTVSAAAPKIEAPLFAAPKAVVTAARAFARGQFAFLTSAAVWISTDYVQKGLSFSGAQAARALIAQVPDIAEKTASNYLNSAKAMAEGHEALIKRDPNGYAKWLSEECGKLGYNLSEPDIRAMLAGKPGAKARAAAEADQKRRNAEAAAEASSAPVVGAEEPAKVEEPAKAEPVKAEEQPAPVAESPTNPALPAAVALLSVTRDSAGALDIMVDERMSVAEMLSIVELLQAQIDKAQQSEKVAA